MKSYDKILIVIVVMLAGLFLAANMMMISKDTEDGRPYRVEIERLAYAIETDGYENADLSNFVYVTRVVQYGEEGSDAASHGNIGSGYADAASLENDGNGLLDIASLDNDFFEGTGSDSCIRMINGKLYRFDYVMEKSGEYQNIFVVVNMILAAVSMLLFFVLIFIRNKILKPFEELSDVPYELSKGNLTIPIKENKYRFFGKFVWGMDMLRENLEIAKQRELDLLREKKMLVLSLSHDIKTPLSAIKLYAKSLSKGLYDDKDKQIEIAGKIDEKADETGRLLSQIIEASREDFLNPKVTQGEFYLSELVEKIADYYGEKLRIMKTGFFVGEYDNCMIKGDFDRSVEVLQNIIENAAKYGDGHSIMLTFTEEEGCKLITVANSGCTLPETELPHIFESFIRGTNAEGISGSGLGLYICRQLMHKMDGEIFAEIKGQDMLVTVVFPMSG